MCYSPLKILNPSRKFNGDMPMYLKVPCGHCADCLRNAHNEWYFRAYMEYLDCRAKGGAAYFLTLTYNDENLPKLTFPNGDVQLCFYKRHIHNFVKYLRIQLKKLGYPYKDIKYLICAEYGGNGTHRPHYHPLFFFPFRIPWKVLFNDNPEKGDIGVFLKAWHYGFIVCSKLGFEIRSAAGIRYATKYVCKNLGFYRNGPVWDYLHGVGVDKETYKMRRSLINDYLPRVWSSSHFGECFIDKHVKTQDDIAGFLAENKFSLNNGEHKPFKIPRYYHLKLEKAINKSLSDACDKVVLENTPIGMDVKHIIYVHKLITEKSELQNINLSYLTQTFPSAIDVAKSVQFLTDNGYYNTNCYLFNRFALDNHEEVCKRIDEYMQVLDIDNLAKYRAYLRDYPLFDEDVPEDMFGYVDDIIDRMIHSEAIPPEYIGTYYQFAPGGVPLAFPIADYGCKHLMPCSKHPYFVNYESVCTLLDYYDMCVSIVKEAAALQKKLEKECVKNARKGDCQTYNCCNYGI